MTTPVELMPGISSYARHLHFCELHCNAAQCQTIQLPACSKSDMRPLSAPLDQLYLIVVSLGPMSLLSGNLATSVAVAAASLGVLQPVMSIVYGPAVLSVACASCLMPYHLVRWIFCLFCDQELCDVSVPVPYGQRQASPAGRRPVGYPLNKR